MTRCVKYSENQSLTLTPSSRRPQKKRSQQDTAHCRSSPTRSQHWHCQMKGRWLWSNSSHASNMFKKEAKAVTQLSTVSTPEQFCFIMRLVVSPLIQLQIPLQLASPANWNFAKEHLTEEATLEEEGANQMLPWPFHPKLAEVDKKHPTRCVTAVVHWLLCKAFKTNISQSKVAKKFLVQP